MISMRNQCRSSTLLLPLCLLLVVNSLTVFSDVSQPSPSSETSEIKPEASESTDHVPHGGDKPDSTGAPTGDHAQNAANLASLAAASVAQAQKADISEITYDQRQNGTQNVRIHLDDVTLIVAPSDGLVSLFAHQQYAQSAGSGASAGSSVQTGSVQGQTSDDDPYAEFDELVNTANFLKSHQMTQQGAGHHGGSTAGGKTKKCTGERCKAKRTKLNLTRYLLPMLAQRHQDNQNNNEAGPHQQPVAQ